MKLNLGCRLDIRDGYENIDIAPLDVRVIKGDIRSLPYQPNSVEEIIAQDVLEHIAPVEVAPAIRHWFTLLSSNGRIRVRTPDIRMQAQLLMSGAWDSRIFTRMVYAGEADPERHRTGFTMDRMTGLLEGAGFVIANTEYEQTNLTSDALKSSNANLIVEAVKP